MTPPVYRFAPSPNGLLHLGHAYSALLNYHAAKNSGGRFLLRLEDIDTTRCTPELEAQLINDLEWLGVSWEEPVRRQSDHFQTYAEALDRLSALGLTYKAFLTRSEIRRSVAAFEEAGEGSWPRDPDGAPVYPDEDQVLSAAERQERDYRNAPHAVRLDMKAAVALAGQDLSWREDGQGPGGETGDVAANCLAWGDVVLARKDTPTSYHMAVVVDDALQGVTHVLRGRDLFWSTSVHRLLQTLLRLPEPRYFHHDLILDEDGQKLSKSTKSTSLSDLRRSGASRDSVLDLLGTYTDVYL